MKKTILFLAAIFILFCGIASSHGRQAVSDEAKRHLDRGMAAMEMAKSPADQELAIKEFEQAVKLAPEWPEAYRQLALAQEKAEKYGDAAASLKQYLRLAPDASDAEAVKSLINKLEYKAENVLTLADIIDVLDTFFYRDPAWQQEGECLHVSGELSFQRLSDNRVWVLMAYRKEKKGLKQYVQPLTVTGPVLKYVTTFNRCDNGLDGNGVSCDCVVEHEIEVVSKRLIRVNQEVLRGGQGEGVRTGDRFSCTFRKKDSSNTGDANMNAKDENGRTQLELAVIGGSKDEVESLMAKGADITTRGRDQQTLLHLAVSTDHTEIAVLLIAKGADINVKDQSGKTPLQCAEINNHKDVADLLKKHGAKY